MLRLAMILGVLCLGATAAHAEFRITFDWGSIPLCTNGRPNTVPNPVFQVRGVPPGTETIEFRMTDLNVPSFRHGGARLQMSGDGTVPAGTFTYRSPCPPDGAHTYEWEATARAGRQVLAVATATRRYPQ